MAESKKIIYNSDYVELVKDLAGISPSIVISKDEGFITIIRTNKSQSICFRLIAPADYFDFDSNKIAFGNFVEFHQLMNAFGSGMSNLQLKGNKVVITTNSGKINYILAAHESLPKAPARLNFNDPELEFNLSSTALSEISKANNLVKAMFANISYKNGSVTIKLFNSTHENSFDKTFAVDTKIDDLSDFDFSIYSQIFSKMPIGFDYKVKIKTKGYLAVSSVKNNMDLFIITGQVKKINSDDPDKLDMGQ